VWELEAEPRSWMPVWARKETDRNQPHGLFNIGPDWKGGQSQIRPGCGFETGSAESGANGGSWKVRSMKDYVSYMLRLQH
jgi:hypothetical protein